MVSIKRWLWLPTVLTVPLLLFVKPGTSWMLALLPLSLLLQAEKLQNDQFELRQGGKRSVLPVTALNPAMLLLAIMLLVSLWTTPDLSLSLSKIAGLLLGFLLFFTLLSYTPTRTAWIVAFFGFIAAGEVSTLLGLLGTQWFTSKLSALNILTDQLPQLVQGLPGAETGIHPNILAGAILWVLPVAVFSAVTFALYPEWFLLRPTAHRRGWIVPTGFLILGGIILQMAIVLVLAQSRSAYLAAVLTAIWVFLVLLPHRARLPTLVLTVIVIAGGIYWANQFGWRRLLTTLMDNFSGNEGAVSTVSFANRLEIWPRAQWAIRDAPLTGIGMDVFRVAMPLLYPLLSYDPAAPVAHAHNELLQAALDLGLPGLVAFLALNLGAFAMLARLLREGGAVRLLALGLGGGLLAHFLFGLTDATALGGRPGVIFWLLLGLIASLYRLITWPAFSEETSSA